MMTYGGIQPFQYVQGNSAVDWMNWLHTFEIFMLACDANSSDVELCAKLLHFAGPKVQQIYTTLVKTTIEGENRRQGPLASGYVKAKPEYYKMIDKLNEFFAPKRNPTFERHLFRQLKQEKDENIDLFVMRLRQQADRCEFGERIEEFIKDQLTEGCASSELRKKILKRCDDSLEKIVKEARIDEMVTIEQSAFKADTAKTESENVNKIDMKKNTFKRKRFQNKNGSGGCGRCGRKGHNASDTTCPAKGQTCLNCGGRDHFARKCFAKKRKLNDSTGVKQETSPKQYKVDESVKFVANTGNDDEDDDCFCIADDCCCIDSDEVVQCKIGNVSATATIDSGSRCNLMDKTDWQKLKTNGIVVFNKKKDCNKQFNAYGGNKLNVLGTFEADLVIATKSIRALFYVVKEPGKFLIGRETAKALGILKIGIDVNKIVEDSVLPKIKGITVDIPLKSNVKPVIQPYRRIPVPVEKAVDEKIESLLNQGIIEKVTGPSRWISPLVIVPRKNSDEIRICVDMRRANEAIERENHPLPTFEEFLPHLAKAKLFSKIDIRNAFHQVN